jgi:hypothetical protein
MPTTLCQGIVIGLDKESRTPTIPTLGGIVNNIDATNSYIETDLNDINYVSEGFLSRYKYTLKAKSSGFFKKLATAIGAVLVLAAAAAATLCTLGAASPVLVGAGIATSAILSTSALGTGLLVTAITAGALTTAATVTIGTQELVLYARQKRNAGEAKRVNGRNEPIPDGYKRVEGEDSRKVVQDLNERYIIKDHTKNLPDAIIVPEY